MVLSASNTLVNKKKRGKIPALLELIFLPLEWKRER